jgi:uncharacterized short protein YbdD (DUF466 family)
MPERSIMAEGAIRVPLRGIANAARGVWWWFTSVLGDRDYERFVAHMQARHPGEPIPSEREFWRSRHAAAEANPAARCC